jgi:hypothetical protein
MSKKIVKTIRGGSLKSYNKFLQTHIDQKSDFKVTSSGMSRLVEFDDGIRYRFFGANLKSKIDGAYFVTSVRNQIDKYIEKHGIIEVKEKPNIQMFNPIAIDNYHNKPICCLDLNSCYWRTAYLLGFIDKELYDKGIESGLKKGLLVSIGALNKTPSIQKYVKGKKLVRSFDNDYSSKYSPFYWAIICKVRDLMMEVYKVLGNDMYMWLTDCAFVKSSKQQKVITIFEKYGFPYKVYTSNFVESTDIGVLWFDCKSNKHKAMYYADRLIDENYNKWKYMKKSYSKNTIL